ncbi:MAG: energy-coupling factor transporter transmembrane component T [Candidatus Tritonobacter lacicola]|nr:energy-coupling factor transporter transmembrane component T [Candidatus Tritonobacter lacicola]
MFPCRRVSPGGLHPVTVLVYTGAAGIAALVLTNPVYLVGLAAVLVITLIRLRAGSLLREYLLFLLPVLIMIVLFNGIFSGEGTTVLFRLPRLPLVGSRAVTLEAVLYGMNMAVKMALILTVFCLYNTLQDMDAAFSFFSGFAFRSLFTVVVSTLMVPRMRRDLERIGAAMRKRGVSFSSGSIISRIRASYPIVKVLLLSSLEGSWESAESMHCRAFGSGRRTVYRRAGMKGWDWIVIAASIISLSGFAVAAGAGRGFMEFYPAVGRLFECRDTVFLAWILSGFVVVCLCAAAREERRCIRSRT